MGDLRQIYYIQSMKKIYILALEHAVVQAIAGTQYCFQTVNMFLTQNGADPLFEIYLVGSKSKISPGSPGFLIQPDLLIEDTELADLVIIPPLYGDLDYSIQTNQAFIPWIIDQQKKGAEIASLCLGAFLLAETGLVDGKKCSTHWGFIQDFKNRYPQVAIQDGAIITEEAGIYSSGGANSYWNLLLHIVEKYVNRETAILLSKYFAIDIGRNDQSAFTIFNGQIEHPDEEIKKAQQIIEKRYPEKLTVDELADEVSLGRRSFERRFKKATNNTVLEYIHRVKIEAAKKKFESSGKNINEVMWEIGYTDPKAFRVAFKKVTGTSPKSYKEKYNKARA